jgi:hypothetical protein
MDELSEQKFLAKGENQREKDKTISYGIQIFSQLGPRLQRGSAPPKRISFDEIIGYEDLKELLLKCFNIKDSCNVLLSGPPASSKTVFLLAIKRDNPSACFIDGANASGVGLVDYLFEHPDTSVICIDELDKLY